MTRQELADNIASAATLRGSFKLRSGVISNLYFDKYQLEADPELLLAISNGMKELVPDGIDLLAGLEMGGIPVATMLSQHTGIPSLFVRKKAKEYGTCKLAEGPDIEGKTLLIVEDVVTSGGAILDAVNALRERGAVVENVICIIDRESGGTENLEKEHLQLTPLFRISEITTEKPTLTPAS